MQLVKVPITTIEKVETVYHPEHGNQSKDFFNDLNFFLDRNSLQPQCNPKKKSSLFPEKGFSAITYNICGSPLLYRITNLPHSITKLKNIANSFKEIFLYLTEKKEESNKRYQSIGQELKRLDCSVVAIQEAWDMRTEDLIKESEYLYFQKVDDKQGLLGRSGLITLSKYPIINSKFYEFNNKAGIEHLVKKGVLWTEIQLPNTNTIDVCNVHLMSSQEFLLSKNKAEEIRLAQIIEVKNIIENIKAKKNENVSVVVLGDFNCEFSKEEELLKELGNDTFEIGNNLKSEEALNKNHQTFAREIKEASSTYRLDRIIVDTKLLQDSWTSSEIVFNTENNTFSDHFGVKTSIIQKKSDSEIIREIKSVLENTEGFAFDLDGTIFDSEEIYFKCFQTALKAQNHILTPKQYSEYCEGKSLDDCEQSIRLEFIISEKEMIRLKDHFSKAWKELLGNSSIHFQEGAKGSLNFLNNNFQKIALVTNSPKSNVIDMFEHKDELSFFNYIITADDIAPRNRKPAPMPYLLAARKLLIDPENMLVLEDSVTGATAAIKAGCKVLFISKNEFENKSLSKEVKEIVENQQVIFMPSMELFYKAINEFY